MADYKETFERWTKKATDKLEEIDSQYDLKGMVDDMMLHLRRTVDA